MPEANPPMPAAAPTAQPLPPDVARAVGSLARTLVAAARSWALYPPEHPAVRTSIDRLRQALVDASGGYPFSFGVTPETLLVDGVPASTRDGAVSEAAAWLHARDVLQLTFAADVPPQSLRAFLAMLAGDVQELRQRGGPARAWEEEGHGGIAIEQIDFERVLADREVQHPARKKDDLWKAIVRAVADRRKSLDEALQTRLLAIGGDAAAIGELARDVIAPNYAADGSPMMTTQAAAVMAAYRHLVDIVQVMAPARRAEVMQNIASATSNMDPHLVFEMLRTPENTVGGAVPVAQGLLEAFDDAKVAQLLATTLAIEGQASQRLADVFDTIAPDEPRKRRVLSLTRSLLGETAFGKSDQFHTLWSSMEELLLTYNERPFVSAQYKRGLDEIGGRAAQMATDLPPEFASLVQTLEQENVRRLSVTLLIDLLRLERDPARAPELASDVAALAEDLLLAGDYVSAVNVTHALAEQAGDPAAVASEGSRVALDGLAETPALVEAGSLLGDMTDDERREFAAICSDIGPAAAEALRPLLDAEKSSSAQQRAIAILRSYGERVITRLAPLVSSPHWYAQRNAAVVLGDIESPQGVPLLQPLLRGSDPRVLREAVRALSRIDDPSAARAVHTVLRAATGGQRAAVVAALVAERDARVVPVLGRILDESDAAGADHQIVLETLDALRTVGDDQAIPHLARVMRRRSWIARRRIRALKIASLETLQHIGTPAAQSALADAAANGDRLLRKLAKVTLAGRVAHG
jgi:HEAT repeat protein